MLHVTPLFAGSPLAPPVSATVPPACTWLAVADMDTVMFGGGGGLLLLQPAMTVTKTEVGSKKVRTNLLFMGPPKTREWNPWQLPDFPKMNVTKLGRQQK
jgi:hypothetical protein